MKFPFNLNNPLNWVKIGLVGIIGAGAYWVGTRNCINANPATPVTNTTITASAGALELIQTANKLVKDKDTCKLNHKSVSSLLNTQFYPLNQSGNNVKTDEFINYAVFKENNMFRYIFGSKDGNYTYYGVCPPIIKRWNLVGNNIENHVFGFGFIPVATIGSISQADLNNFTKLNTHFISPNDVKDIVYKKSEDSNGFFAKQQNNMYNSILSSKGLIFQITQKNGQKTDCYLFNNYDNAGTIKWKEML